MRTVTLLALDGILLVAAVVAGVGCRNTEPLLGEADGGDTDTGYPYDLDAGLRCDGGMDFMQPSPDGVGEIPTGVERCADGSRHRYAAVPCTSDSFDEPLCTAEYFDYAACTDGQLAVVCPFDENWCDCITPCASDADCADGEACLCDEGNKGITRCLPAECRTDADCGGTECGVSTDNCALENRLACRTADDECHGSPDCADELNYCVDLGDAWGCVEGMDCE
jgi:hypothetical protein